MDWDEERMMGLSKYKKRLNRVLPRKVVASISSMISSISNYYCRRKYVKLSKKRICKSFIKVGFLIQMPEIWDKQSPLFEALVHDERFQPVLILIPAYDYVNKTVKTNYDDNYFQETYPNYCISAYGNKKWISIKSMELDYLFYQRPYDWYLPKELRSVTVSNHTRCCYIPYAFWPLKYDLCGYNRSFFRSLFFGFLESQENREEIIRYGDYEAEKRYLFCGYPSLTQKYSVPSCNQNDTTTILWTPRWNNNDNIGGSHFFEYKDRILTLLNEFHDINLILRPHPLSFQYYVSVGRMTDDEVNTYKRNVTESGAKFDNNRLIDETFKNVDILITDISSIVYSYILYEKPIIFCNTEVSKSPSFEFIMDCMYIAESWEDILHWVCEIMSGNDELSSKRHCHAERIRRENKAAVENIIEHLVEGK